MAMKVEGWRYFNHAMIATGAPGEQVNMEPVITGDIWKGDGYVLFARWVSEYDCGHPTEWWYCLKDDEYNIELLNSKKRYRITRGRRCFDIKVIDENEYLDELVRIQIKAYENYPNEYRPDTAETSLRKHILSWKENCHTVFGAFNRETMELCGYSLVNEFDKYCYFAQQKVDPACERDEINAALVDGVVLHYEDRIKKGFPLVDGQRNTVHETAFQDYLCRLFGFRKAYCKLNIQYRGWVKVIVNVLYPFRECISRCKGRLFRKISSVLDMEQIRRSFEQRN